VPVVSPWGKHHGHGENRDFIQTWRSHVDIYIYMYIYNYIYNYVICICTYRYSFQFLRLGNAIAIRRFDQGSYPKWDVWDRRCLRMQDWRCCAKRLHSLFTISTPQTVR
jgi:hypothetical protein